MSSTLLVMDMQRNMLSRIGDSAGLLARSATAISRARERDIRVIYVCLNFRPGYPEVSPHNKMFSALKTSGAFTTRLGDDIPAELAPREGELVIAKHRVSAFSGNGLEMILRASGTTELVLLGIATSGIVLSTARAAMDLDYQVTVVRDCCADSDDEVHRVLCDKVFARHNKVVDSTEL